VTDKFTPLVVAALANAAANPAGKALYGSNSVPGLFPNTAAGKSAAGRAIAESLLSPLRTGPNGKETFAATDRGLRFLLDQSNPKAVLEDLVRGLEARQVQADELLSAARSMSAELSGLKATVAAVLPAVVHSRVARPAHPLGGEGNGTMTRSQPYTAAGTLAALIQSRLADWSGSAGAGQDCPLPDLYRSLTVCDDLTVGRFHDGLRSLHAAGKVYLHPWTGPLYTLPEPAFALLIGHEVAYYASQSGQWPVASGQKSLAVAGH
jgi:hypothetical protein